MTRLTRAALLPCLLLVAHTAHAQSTLFRDAFQEYSHGQLLDLQWQVMFGDWTAEDDRLVGRAVDRGTCWASACPVSGDQELTALVTPGERLREGAWLSVGLTLWDNPSDFWRVALVEGPEGRRYAELLERHDEVWQAQNEPGMELELLPDGIEGFEWETGHTYRLRLRISAGSIEADVADYATGDVLFRRGHSLPEGANAVRRGRVGLIVDSAEGVFDDVQATGTLAQRDTPSRAAAVIDTGLPECSAEVIAGLTEAVEEEGIACSVLPAQSLAASPTEAHLLVLPHTRRLPVGLADAVDAHLRRGRTAIFLGGPFADEAVARQGDEWVSLAEALRATPTETVCLDFGQLDPTTLLRAAGPEEASSTREVAGPGPEADIKPLRVDVEGLRSWDTLSWFLEETPFQPGQTLTCFWAKGGAGTTHLTVEWRERDGSRWMTGVPLTRQWQRHVLAPADLKYWPDSRSQGRGDGKDHFRPENADAFTFGLAKSHSPIADGAHTYWIAEVGTATSPLPSSLSGPLLLEAVSPPYKTFRPTVAGGLRGVEDQTIGDPTLKLPAPGEVRCAMPRARGLGVKMAHAGRWAPVLEVQDRAGAHRGVAGSLYVSTDDPYPEAAWGALGIEDSQYLARHMAELGPLVGRMARRLVDGVFLLKAGADQFSYLPGETPVLGAQVGNRSGEAQELRLTVSVTQEGHSAPAFSKSWPVSAAAGILTGESAPWERPAEAGVYVVRSELQRGDELIDAISHDIIRLPTASAKASDFVTVANGDFRLDEEPWHPHGVNYWPSNATALESFSYWLHWLHPINYDPAVINQDLKALAALGVNSVSIALRNRAELPALNHFLYRCAENGIRVNVFVGGGDPSAPDPQHVVDLIETGQLAENPWIYAWDIAWEPHFGPYENRRRHDGRWAQWVADQYGSVANAERDWGVPLPRAEDGSITGPSQEQILNDGEHRVMVAAYRRFLDDLVSAAYGDWARKVRAVDPRHLIGVRSGYGGTGQAGIDPQAPFDLIAGAKHLDFTSPEGYGLGGPWANFERGGFTTAYGRYAGNGKPVFWAEFGMSIHPDYTPERIEAQRLLYEHTYRMVTWSGASGSAGWWFPGGFRVGENSDYGFMNPDGTPRPSALETRKWAKRMAEARPDWGVDHWITIDRDLHPRGYSQVWARHRDEYVGARRDGKVVGLRTEGTDTTSVTAPMVAVGNTRADGTNPHKYLDAEFSFVRVRAGGEWVDVEPGSTVSLPAGRRVELVASPGNTGESTWMAPTNAQPRLGGVFLVSTDESDVAVEEPLRGDVPRFSDRLVGPVALTEGLTGEAKVALRMEAKGRTAFGAHFRFTLRAE